MRGARQEVVAPLPQAQALLSCPVTCTESLSDEELHLGVRQMQRGQSRPVSPSLCHFHITCPSQDSLPPAKVSE